MTDHESKLFAAVHEYACVYASTLNTRPQRSIGDYERSQLLDAIRAWASSPGALPGWFSAWELLRAKAAVCDAVLPFVPVLTNDCELRPVLGELEAAIAALRALQTPKGTDQ